jgi:hypothetical protein
VYAASTPAASFGELLSGRRRNAQTAAKFQSYRDRAGGAVDDECDPVHPTHGIVTADWRNARSMTNAKLSGTSSFIDVSHPSTLTFLYSNFVPVITSADPSLAASDFDLSDVMSRNRTLTQHLARYLYDLPREAFSEMQPGEEIAGIRYLSRHSPEWECWALFADRIEGHLAIGESRAIVADDPDLLAVAKHFGLSVETDIPGEYLRPWLDS